MAGLGESCGDCRFHRKRELTKEAAAAIGADPLIGRCRRFPQEVEKHARDWCGEFERRTT